MLTKIAQQAIQTVPVWNGQNNTYNAKPMFPNDPVKNVDGTNRWVSFVNGNILSSINVITANNKNAGFHFGSGTNAESEDNYYLQTPITAYLSGVLNSFVRGVEGSKPYMEATLTVTNTGTSSDITVAEIGIITGNIWVCTSNSATSASGNNMLFDRTILENPIVLTPLQTAAIRYRITCDMSFS